MSGSTCLNSAASALMDGWIRCIQVRNRGRCPQIRIFPFGRPPASPCIRILAASKCCRGAEARQLEALTVGGNARSARCRPGSSSRDRVGEQARGLDPRLRRADVLRGRSAGATGRSGAEVLPHRQPLPTTALLWIRYQTLSMPHLLRCPCRKSSRRNVFGLRSLSQMVCFCKYIKATRRCISCLDTGPKDLVDRFTAHDLVGNPWCSFKK